MRLITMYDLIKCVWTWNDAWATPSIHPHYQYWFHRTMYWTNTKAQSSIVYINIIWCWLINSKILTDYENLIACYKYSNALSYQLSFLFPSEPIIFCVFACAIDLRWMLTSDWFPGTLWCFRYHMINYVQKHIHLPDEMLMSLQSTLFKWQATLHGPNMII